MQSAVVLVICGLLVSACSNIIPEEKSALPSKIILESDPPSAEVRLSSGGSCRTPCSLPIPDKAGSYTVTFNLPGYKPREETVTVTREKSNWFASEKTKIDLDTIVVALEPAGSAPEATRQR